MPYLQTLTNDQLELLNCRVWDRMLSGDGYQMFGYDARTLAITHPAWWKHLQEIRAEIIRRINHK